MKHPPIAIILGLSAVLAACSSERPSDATAGLTSAATGVTTAPTSSSSGGGGGGESSTTAETSDGAGTSSSLTGTSAVTGGAKFDLGASDLGGGTTGPKETGCTKVDFLFVIDNSTSMEDNQTALIASFPGFINAIQTALGDVTDFHVMVVDTDADGRCAQPCDPNDPDYVQFCAAANYHACNAQLDACDTERGAGVLHPVGSFASNKACPVFGGNRYMIAEEPDLLGAFACVAQVGTAGSAAERPMNSMEAAVGEALNSPNGCNGGFLRDDAILVVTFLSDDGNYVDKGTPADWKASLVAAKNGDDQAIVVAGLILHPELDCINKQTDGTQGKHWQEFIELWDAHGVSGSICADDYAPFFEQAVAAIDQTCEQFNPPG